MKKLLCALLALAMMLDAVSGAHIYNKNIVQAEGFTEVRGVYQLLVKPFAVPFFHHFRLFLGKICPHRKIGFGKIKGFAVIEFFHL